MNLKIKWDKAKQSIVKNVADRFSKYDFFFWLGFITSIIAGIYGWEKTEAAFFGVCIFGAINVVVKNARPDVTVLIMDGKVIAATEED